MDRPSGGERPEERTAPTRALHGRWYFSNWWIVTGAVITVLVVVLSRLTIGTYYSGIEARELLAAMRDAALFLTTAIATGSATIIALMLTLLGLAHETHDELHRAVHNRIRAIAWLSAAALLGAVLIMVTITVPIVESDSIGTHWYRTLWWVFSVAIALDAGLFVSVVLTLLATIIGALEAMRPA